MIVFIKIFEPLGNVSSSLLLMLFFFSLKMVVLVLVFTLKWANAENQPGSKRTNISPLHESAF